MTPIADSIGEFYEPPSGEPPDDDAEQRRLMMFYLFKLFGVEDFTLAQMYLDQTDEIPLDKLRAGLRVLVRRYHWPKLPRVADIWLAAREVAGMHRQQYRAGRYMPAPREWPPEGKRYAIQAGEFECASRGLGTIALPNVELRLLEDGGEASE